MKNLLPEFSFCVVDLETTGLSPDKGSGIIEVGGVLIEEGRIGDTFEQFTDPGHSIPEEITQITGITNDDIQGAPPTESVLDDFMDFIEDTILIAHNARFDLSFLHTYSPRTIDHDYIDTLRLARQLLDTDKNSLGYLAEQFDLSLENAHRATDDALATAELFLMLTEEIQEPADYFRCKLPGPIMEKAPVNVPEPSVDFSQKNDPGTPPREWILYGLYELDSSLGVTKMAKILSGSNSQAVEKYDSLQSYGKLETFTQDEIRRAIEEAIENQPFCEAVSVSIRADALEDAIAEGGADYTELTGRLIDVEMRIEYEGVTVETSMAMEDGYPLMQVDAVQE